MDRINIPTCALHRQSTTVIVRIKMDVSSCCGQPEPCPVSDSARPALRPSGCERCARTRLISQYSDCDSGIVEKCRPYKSSAARSRYVNVCAAVCLLLLIGGLSPRSYAAPFRSRTMDRQRRASEEENAIWRDPCHYNTTNSGGLYESKAATKVAQQAKNVLQKAKAYSGLFAKLHSFDKFDDLLKEWKEDWLRKFPWFIEEVLPENKILFKTADEGEIHKMMDSIDSHLPVMYKALKMIVASLHKLSESLKDDGISDDQVLAERVKETMDDVRAVLCYFYDLMKARNIEILPVYDSEVPEINKVNKMDIALYIYRDTLNYLEYVTQVFQIMAESDLPAVV